MSFSTVIAGAGQSLLAATRLPDNYNPSKPPSPDIVLPSFLPIGTFVRTANETVTIDAYGTVQIRGGYAGCLDDIVNAQFAVTDGQGSVVVSGPITTVDRENQYHDCALPPLTAQRVNDDSGVHQISFPYPMNVFTALANQPYTFGIQFWDKTDDAIAFTWSNVVLTSFGTTFAKFNADMKNLGNRVPKDSQGNFYILLGNFLAPGDAVHITGSGRIEIGDGSGTDRLTAQIVIKEGPGHTDQSFPGTKRSIYEGPVSAEATRSTDQVFDFSYSLNDFAPTVVNGAYSVYIKLHVGTDDTIRVYWSDTILTARYSLGSFSQPGPLGMRRGPYCPCGMHGNATCPCGRYRMRGGPHCPYRRDGVGIGPHFGMGRGPRYGMGRGRGCPYGAHCPYCSFGRRGCPFA